MIAVILLPITLLFFILAFCSLAFFSYSSFKTNFMDLPNKRKIHNFSIARIGGFAILIAFFAASLILYIVDISLFSFFIRDNLSLSILFAAVLVFIIGFFDDTTFFEVGVIIKFIVQFTIAFGIVFLFDIRFSHFNFLGIIYDMGILGYIISLFWIVGVMNAFNIIDGIDGLAGSVTLIALIISSIIFVLTGYTECLLTTLPLIAIVTAFLVFNYPPASVFAGDTGSLFFGAAVAICSMKIGSFAESGIDSLSALYIVLFPCIEVGVSMLRRYWYAYSDNKRMRDCIKMVVTPDNLHMHHRLIFRGFNHEQALKFLSFFSFSISSAAIVLTITHSNSIKILVIIYSCYMFFSILKFLEYGKGSVYSIAKEIPVCKTIAITGESEYFENSIRSYVNGKYWITRFERVSDIASRRVDYFVIYNEKSENIECDIQKVFEIRDVYTIPVFLITSADITLYPLLRNEKVHIVSKPVDISVFINDLEGYTIRDNFMSKNSIESVLSMIKNI